MHPAFSLSSFTLEEEEEEEERRASSSLREESEDSTRGARGTEGRDEDKSLGTLIDQNEFLSQDTVESEEEEEEEEKEETKEEERQFN